MNDSDAIKMQQIAKKVISNIDHKKDDENFGFVVTILMIISITLTLIRIIQECNKKKTQLFSASKKYSYYGSEIKALAMRKSWFTKMMIKKAIRKEMGREAYRAYGIDVLNAILKTGENLTEDEIITLVEAANV